ncbi:MFS transporter [Mariniluteicoccus endophyticus]
MTDPTPSQTLRALLWPVYVPTITFAAGAAALVPAYILLALRLGFGEAQVALIGTWLGAVTVVASAAAGYLVQGLGERTALAVTTGVGIAGLLAAWATTATDLPGARWVMVAALTGFALAESVWGIARQGLVADLAAPQHLGRAMNTFGAAQRIGRVFGPLVAAGIMALWGPAEVFGVGALVSAASLALIVRHLRTPASAVRPTPPTEVSSRRALHGLVLLGLGIITLAALRTAKETLIPLWGARGLHLSDHLVALVVGIAAAFELLLFWPAGIALDRLGRMPVVVTSLVLMAAGLVALPQSTGPTWFVICALVVGLGDGVGSGIVKTIGVDLAPVEGRGRFLGWWQSVAATGNLAAPALASAVIATASLGAALAVIGAIGLVGAAWMAYWTPRFIPRRRV